MSDPYHPFNLNLASIPRLSKAQSRSLSAENPTGEKGKGAMEPADPEGAARDLGLGWKTRPCIRIQAGETTEIANIEGPGSIQQIWMTCSGINRFTILRFYWDDEETPSVECPIGDFFASPYTGASLNTPYSKSRFKQLNSLPVCVNPGRAFNCYWQMPFRKNCRITVENIGFEAMTLFYQINYQLVEVPDDMAYFHAQFRRTNPLPYKEVYTVLDDIKGQGHYIGTAMAWGVNNNNWWGEGEIKFYMDGDTEYPTICGTGTEDYFCGSYNFENQKERIYQEFSTPYAGMPDVVTPEDLYSCQQRFSLYRWHIVDPIRFQEDLKVTIQALGWRTQGRYLPLQDDLASVAFWYQAEPHSTFPELPDRDYLEII